MDNQTGLIIEFVYFIVIASLSTMVYYRTKKIYDFSKHIGIGYFRNAFLFFSLIYFSRFVILNINFLDPIIGRELVTSIGSMSMFLVIYFSLLSIFYLAASFSWIELKFISDNSMHLASLFISSVIYFMKLPIVLLAFGLFIVIFLILKVYFNYKHKNRKIFSKLFVIYALLLMFWLFDMVPYTQQFMKFELKISGYAFSILIFLFINYKIKRVLNIDEKEK